MEKLEVGQTSFEKGFEQGFEQGIIIGQRAVTERLLIRRFGPLSDAVRERLAAWPPDQVLDLGVAALTATSLEELGLEQGD